MSAPCVANRHLPDADGAENFPELAVFSAQTGKEYVPGGLLAVGQATNGRDNKFRAADMQDVSQRRNIVDGL